MKVFKKLALMAAMVTLVVTLAACEESEPRGIIYGGPQGWAATEFLSTKFDNEEDYGELIQNFEFYPVGSSATLNSTLQTAYDNEEPWVGYHWAPTWPHAVMDLRYLQDDLEYDADLHETHGLGDLPAGDVTVVVTDGFDGEYPEIYEFISNYETTTEITSEMINWMVNEAPDDAEEADAAIWFLENHEDIWTQWLPEDVASNVQTALDGGDPDVEQSDRDPVELAAGDWESIMIHNEIAMYIMEHGYGQEAQQTITDTPVQIESLRNGTFHINLEMWVANLVTYEDDTAEGKYHEVSVNFIDPGQGLYIPGYLQDEYEIYTIQDLNDHVELFEHSEVR